MVFKILKSSATNILKCLSFHVFTVPFKGIDHSSIKNLKGETMKKLFIVLCVAGLVGCSSNKKEVVDTTQSDASKTAQEAAEAAKTATQTAKDAIDNATKDLKDAATDLKDKATEKANADADSAEGMTNFGEYTGTETSKLTCTNGDDVRTITVLDGPDGGCGVVYNKAGESRTVAIAKYAKDHCSKVQDKMRANLEAPGFTCQ